jgi:processive 1,2-diacylglycerol beta-glucosyltransferase
MRFGAGRPLSARCTRILHRAGQPAIRRSGVTCITRPTRRSPTDVEQRPPPRGAPQHRARPQGIVSGKSRRDHLHPFCPPNCSRARSAQTRLGAPVWLQVTDFDLHRMWVQPHMRGYFAANAGGCFPHEGARPRTTARSTSPAFPVMPAFPASLERELIARANGGFDCRAQDPLLMGGGEGIGRPSRCRRKAAGDRGDFQLVAMAGRNVAALRGAARPLPDGLPAVWSRRDSPTRSSAGWRCADFRDHQARRLSRTSECLAMGLPMIVNSPIPGQERAQTPTSCCKQGVALEGDRSAHARELRPGAVAEPRTAGARCGARRSRYRRACKRRGAVTRM